MKRNSSPSLPRSAPAPDLALRPSRAWRGLLLVAHAAAFSTLPILPYPSAVGPLLAVLLLASLYRAFSTPPWTRLCAADRGSWWLVDRDGTAVEGRLRGVGLRHPWLVTLPLRFPDGRCRVVAVWGDAVSADAHAALRRWLAADATPAAR